MTTDREYLQQILRNQIELMTAVEYLVKNTDYPIEAAMDLGYQLNISNMMETSYEVPTNTWESARDALLRGEWVAIVK